MTQEQVAGAEDDLGGTDARQQIGVLPPVAPGVSSYPISPRTGEPARPVLLGIAVGLLLAGSVVAAAGLVKVLWDAASVTRYHVAARVLEWTKPNPVSFLTIVMVLTIGAIGAAVVAAPAAIAYNSWNGRSWTRVGGLVAVAVSLLTILLNPLAMVAMAPVALGAGLLWLPQIAGYFAVWRAIRVAPQIRRGWAENVVYGTLPRYS